MTDIRPEWAPASINLDQPSSARVWDYFLGGSHNLAPGSRLILQHASYDGQSGDIIKMLQMWNSKSPEPMYWRDHDEIEAFFDGFTILEPGVVQMQLWRSNTAEQERAEQDHDRYASYAAVGVKPGSSTG